MYNSNYKYPFTLVTGEGNGVSYSSLNRNGQLFPDRGIGQAKINPYFNAGNGNLIIQDHVCMAEESSGMIKLCYWYNMQQTSQPWRLGISSLKVPQKNGNELVLTEDDGHITTYKYDQVREYYTAPGCGDGRPIIRVDKENKQWIWFDPKSGCKKIYNWLGLLKSVTDAKGRTSTLYYDEKNQLTKILSPSGNSYEIRRAEGLVEFYMLEEDNETLLQTHEFDKDGLLTKTLIGKDQNYAINYKYNNGRFDTVTQTDNSSFSADYVFSKGIYKVQDLGMGETENYQVSYPKEGQTVIDYGDNQKITVTADGERRLKELRHNNGFFTRKEPDVVTSFTYNDVGQVKTITKPNGAVYKRTYANAFGLLSFVQNPNNRSSVYICDENYGSLLEKIDYWDEPPLVGKFLSKRFIYEHKVEDKIPNRFLRFSLTPTGGVTEYCYDEQGNVESRRCYPKKSFDLSSYLIDRQPSLDEMVKWANDYVKSYPKDIFVTNYSYNCRGQVDIVTEDEKSTYYFYNHFGKWTTKLEQQDGEKKSVSTERDYDALYRLIRETKGAQDKVNKQTT